MTEHRLFLSREPKGTHDWSAERLRARPTRCGALLLVVLMVLVLLMTALTEIARTTTRSTRSVLQRGRQLQRHVAINSVQDTMLRHTTAIVGRSAVGNTVTDQIEIGSVRIDVRVRDENTRLNLNMIYDRAGAQEMLRCIQDLVPPTPTVLTPTAARQSLHPRRPSHRQHVERLMQSDEADPAASGSDARIEFEDQLEDTLPPAFASWGEIFDLAAFPDHAPPGLVLPALTDRVTLWGNGRLNLWRADEDTIVAAASDVVPIALARRLAWKVRQAKIRQVSHVLRQTISNTAWRAELSERFSDLSETTSLWIGASDGYVTSQRMHLTNVNPSGQPSVTRFDYP